MWASGARWGLAQAQYDQTRVRSAWGSIYTDILKNLVIATREAETLTPRPSNSIAQLKIYSAFVYSQTTYLWGDIPFTEAATGLVDQPKFDSQQTVLNGTLKLIDDALLLIDANSKTIGAPNDLYYGGDMAKWRRFANSLKFRILMTMVDADPTKSAAITAMQGLPMIASRADEMKVQYSTQAGRQNPRFSFTQIFRGGVQQDWYASNVLFAELLPIERSAAVDLLSAGTVGVTGAVRLAQYGRAVHTCGIAGEPRICSRPIFRRCRSRCPSSTCSNPRHLPEASGPVGCRQPTCATASVSAKG